MRRFFQHPMVDMLRSLTHLTIDLILVTLELFKRDGYVPKARSAVANLCLSLTGASKLEELTISVERSEKLDYQACCPQ